MRKFLFALGVLIAAAFAPKAAHAACTGGIPYTFTDNVSYLTAATTNSNNNFLLSCATTVDNTQIGNAGLYASQIIPTTGAQATFGGNQIYSFPAGISANTRPSFLVTAPPYNAKCDGTTDDGTAIQAAATAASGVGNLAFPLFKTCLTNSPISITANTGVVGDPAGYGILKAGSGFPATAGNQLIHIGPTSGTTYSFASPGNNVWVDHMKLDGTNLTSNVAYTNLSIFPTGVNHFYLTNSYIYNFPEYGVFVGNAGTNGTDFTQNMQDVRVINTIFDSNGRVTNGDQLGGGYVTGEFYKNITCINSHGTCIDNVMVFQGVWDGINSDMAGVNKGSIVSDYGSQYLNVENSYINGGSIKIFGALASTVVYPQHITIAHNHIQNAHTAISLAGGNPNNANAFTSAYNAVIDNDVYGDHQFCFAGTDIQFSEIIGNRCSKWDVDAAGNVGVLITSTAGVNSALGNVIADNVFDTASSGHVGAYSENTNAHTGGNKFHGNSCGPRPSETCTASFDAGASQLTDSWGNTNFTAGSVNGSFRVGTINAGTVNATSVVSTGAVSGTTGTFSGAVNGASYTGGPISGTTGTFSGAVSGASYTGGAISGTTGTFSGAATSPTIAKIYQAGSQLTSSPHFESFVAQSIGSGASTTFNFGTSYASGPACSATSHNNSTTYPVNISGNAGTGSVVIFNGNPGPVTVDVICIGQ